MHCILRILSHYCNPLKELNKNFCLYSHIPVVVLCYKAPFKTAQYFRVLELEWTKTREANSFVVIVLNIGNQTRNSLTTVELESVYALYATTTASPSIYRALYIKITHLWQWLKSSGLHFMYGALISI